MGYRVALVTDGRLSGASGKIAAAIHVTPEAFCGGEIGLIRDGDMIEFDAVRGVLNVNADLSLRHVPEFTYQDQPQTWGRNLFAGFRSQISSADTGATILN